MANITIARLRPRMVTASTKDEIMRIIRGRHTSWSCYGNQRQSISAYVRDCGVREKKTVVLFNLQKIRKKCTKENIATKRKLMVKKTIIRPNHWVGYVYEVPIAVVKKAVQKARTFELVMVI